MREGVRTARETAAHSAWLRAQIPTQARVGFELESGVVVVFELRTESERQIWSQRDLVLNESAEQVSIQNVAEESPAPAR